MRERFYATAAELVESDGRIAVVFADIGTGKLGAIERKHADRVVNVGIREQLMIGVASGLALTGFRPIVHSFAPFVVELRGDATENVLGGHRSGGGTWCRGKSRRSIARASCVSDQSGC